MAKRSRQEDEKTKADDIDLWFNPPYQQLQNSHGLSTVSRQWEMSAMVTALSRVVSGDQSFDHASVYGGDKSVELSGGRKRERQDHTGDSQIEAAPTFRDRGK